MKFNIPLHAAKEIKRYCQEQDFEEDDKKESCRYCVFNLKGSCMLHDTIMGFPSQWKTP